MKQIKMFYIDSHVDQKEAEINAFLKSKGDDIIDVQMSSWRVDGGDTLDSIIVIFNEKEV